MPSDVSPTERISQIIDVLCDVQPDRRPGSSGNDEAVDVVAEHFAHAGWAVSLPEFPCLDWRGGEGSIEVDGVVIELTPSPYGTGVDTTGVIRVVERTGDLVGADLSGAVVVVAGELVSEPMTPKAFPFYGSAEHSTIIAALEAAQPAALVAVTGKHPPLCGALDPYPWIEDGDFAVPAAAVRPGVGRRLLESEGRNSRIRIDASRVPSRARNVIARLGSDEPRITVCAHIDTKPGTPGAVDNATGVATLMMLAEALGHRADLPIGVELLAVNGEDHFSGAGEVDWLRSNGDRLEAIELFVNIDGMGYRKGRTAFSLYNVDERRTDRIRNVLAGTDGLVEGPAWYQSDHAILAMRGRPALAFTTEFIDEMLAEVFHSSDDVPDQVAPQRVVELAAALERLITEW